MALTNTGDEVATTVAIVDAPPAGTSVIAIDDGGLTVECSTDGLTFGACPVDLSTVTDIEWSTAALDTTTPVVVGFTVRVDLPIADGTLIPNTAAASSTETGAILSNDVETLVTAAPLLTLTKAVDPAGTAAPGDVLTYTLGWANDGSADALDVAVTDAVPDGTVYVAGSASPGAEFLVAGAYQSAEPADPTEVAGLRWSAAVLGYGQAGSGSFQVQLDDVLPVDSTIDNTAIVAATGLGPVSAAAATAVDSAPVLTVEKSALASTLQPGGELTYSISIEVGGNAPADPLVIVDELPAATEFVSATDGGVHADGVVTWNLGSREPGFTMDLFLTVRLTGNVAGGDEIVNTVTASATGAVNGTADAAVVAQASAVLELFKNATVATVTVGDSVSFTLILSNTGDGIATGVTVTDLLPAGLEYAAASPPPSSTGPPTWNIGDLDPGESIMISVVADVVEADDLTNIARAGAVNAASVEAQVTISTSEPLPRTGTNVVDFLRMGLLGLLIGTAMVVIAGTRRRERTPPATAS